MVFIGIDTGIQGAIAVISSAGHILSLEDMPLEKGNKATGHYNPQKIHRRLKEYRRLPIKGVAIEWNQSQPGEGAMRSRNFGMGMAYLEMALIILKFPYVKVYPQKWKNQFGLMAKKLDPGLRLHLSIYDALFPNSRIRITGPRGGIKDGRLEAALIAEYSRQTYNK